MTMCLPIPMFHHLKPTYSNLFTFVRCGFNGDWAELMRRGWGCFWDVIVTEESKELWFIVSWCWTMFPFSCIEMWWKVGKKTSCMILVYIWIFCFWWKKYKTWSLYKNQMKVIIKRDKESSRVKKNKSSLAFSSLPTRLCLIPHPSHSSTKAAPHPNTFIRGNRLVRWETNLKTTRKEIVFKELQ